MDGGHWPSGGEADYYSDGGGGGRNSDGSRGEPPGGSYGGPKPVLGREGYLYNI